LSDETALEDEAADATIQLTPANPVTTQARKASAATAPTNPMPTLSQEPLDYFDLKQKLLDLDGALTRLDSKAAATLKNKIRNLIFLTDTINTGLRHRHDIEIFALTRSQQLELYNLKKKKHEADFRALQKTHKDETEATNQDNATVKTGYVHAEQVLVEEKRFKVQVKTCLEVEIGRKMKSMPEDAIWSIVDQYVLPELARQTKRMKMSDSEEDDE
jgi:hypothetical protein